MEARIISILFIIIGISVMGYCGYNKYKFENVENLNKPTRHSKKNLLFVFTPIVGLLIFGIGAVILLISIILS